MISTSMMTACAVLYLLNLGSVALTRASVSRQWGLSRQWDLQVDGFWKNLETLKAAGLHIFEEISSFVSSQPFQEILSGLQTKDDGLRLPSKNPELGDFLRAHYSKEMGGADPLGAAVSMALQADADHIWTHHTRQFRLSNEWTPLWLIFKDKHPQEVAYHLLVWKMLTSKWLQDGDQVKVLFWPGRPRDQISSDGVTPRGVAPIPELEEFKSKFEEFKNRLCEGGIP